MINQNIYSKAVKTAFLLLAISVTSSCGSLPTVSMVAPVDWDAVVHQKNKIQSWEIKGRVAIQTEEDGGTLDLFWNQDEDDYAIRLVAPMGQGHFLSREI